MRIVRRFRRLLSAFCLLPSAFCLLPFACCLLLGGCAKKQANQLVVGMELSSPPFEMTDEHNRPNGIGVDLARALAASLGKELVIENTAFAGLIPALQTGKIDLIISSMTATEERRQVMAFSEPYVRTGICLLLSGKSDARTAEDLNRAGRRIVVKNGTTGSTFAREHLPKAEVLQISEEAACVLEVVEGKSDAFIYDQMSVYRFHNDNPATTRAILTPVQREDWAVGLRKGDDELRGRVNGFLREFKAKHGVEALAEKYLHDQAAFQEMGSPFS